MWIKCRLGSKLHQIITQLNWYGNSINNFNSALIRQLEFNKMEILMSLYVGKVRTKDELRM